MAKRSYKEYLGFTELFSYVPRDYFSIMLVQDLPRTFPGHPWLDTPEGHAALRRVLVGYSFRDSDVGYCQVILRTILSFVEDILSFSNFIIYIYMLVQGLNYVAALLLLVMKTEEEAFWMLAVLLENVLVSDCYTTNLSGCHVEQRVFKDLLTKKCPRLFSFLYVFVCNIYDLLNEGRE